MARAITLAVLFLAAASATATADDVDWKFFGRAQFSGAEHQCFFDAKGVIQQPPNHLRVWVKCLLQGDMVKIADDIKTDETKKIIENSAQKLASGYMPPIVLLEDIKPDAVVEIMMSEEIANTSGIQPQSRILYELDCANRMMRELSLNFFVKGNMQGSDKPREWQHIAPETNISRLSKIVCRPPL